MRTQRRTYVDMQQNLSYLTTFIAVSWRTLGNILLLIGGDDSVEIGFKFHDIQLLDSSSLNVNR